MVLFYKPYWKAKPQVGVICKGLVSVSEAQVAQLAPQGSSDFVVTVPSSNLLKLIIKLIVKSH